VTTTTVHATAPAVRLGLRENVAQFSLLVLVNAFVGAMVGIERSILPLLAEQEFQLAARTAILSFIVVFGVTRRSRTTLLDDSPIASAAGIPDRRLAVAVPVPFLLMWAPTWTWVLVANGFLGISQGLTWSTTVIMKIDLVGPTRRGLAMGLNEFAGYIAVAAAAWATGWIAAHQGLRPEPFYLGVVFVTLGLGLSLLLVRETQSHVTLESGLRNRSDDRDTHDSIFWHTTIGDRNLSTISQAGLVNSLNDSVVGSFPLFFAAAGMGLERTCARRHVSRHMGFNNSEQARSPTVLDGVAHRRWYAGCRRAALRSPQCPMRFSGSAWVRCSLALGPRWSIRRFSPALATLPLPPGVRRPSVSIASGEISDMRSARSSPASRRIFSG
jgi:hypothetical protein